MRTQTESIAAMQLQMDAMLRTIQPPQLLTMSVPTPPVSAAKVAQIVDEAPVGYVRGGVALDNETELSFLPSDWERLTTPIEHLGLASEGSSAAGGMDTRPMVLFACAPVDCIHGDTYVDGSTSLWFHPTTASQVPGSGNVVGGRYWSSLLPRGHLVLSCINFAPNRLCVLILPRVLFERETSFPVSHCFFHYVSRLVLHPHSGSYN